MKLEMFSMQPAQHVRPSKLKIHFASSTVDKRSIVHIVASSFHKAVTQYPVHACRVFRIFLDFLLLCSKLRASHSNELFIIIIHKILLK